MPLVKEASLSQRWMRFLSYFVAGAATSVVVAAGLTLLGSLLPEGAQPLAAPLALAIAALGLIRWAGIPIPLPQARRQTQRVWALILPGPVVPVLWGADVGLFFSTRITWLGAWLVPALAVLSRDLAFAVMLFLAYWCGRTATILVAPFLASRPGTVSGALEALDAHHPAMRYVYVAALVIAMAVYV